MNIIINMLQSVYEENKNQAIICRRHSADWCYSHMRAELLEKTKSHILIARQAQMSIQILKPRANIYRHIKSGTLYTVIENNVVDATNGEHKKAMVLYKNVEAEQLYVRDWVEFHEKFEKVATAPTIPVTKDELIKRF